MTKTVQVYDERNSITMTAGYLPTIAKLQMITPKSPSFLHRTMSDFDSVEEAVAWTIGALCRRIMYLSHGRHRYSELAKSMPLDIWILGEPNTPTARFAPWFSAKPRDAGYRIVIHHSLLTIGNEQIADYTGYAYHVSPPPLERREHLSHEQKVQAKTFLEQLLQTFQYGGNKPAKLIGQTQHRYWFSKGLPGSS